GAVPPGGVRGGGGDGRPARARPARGSAGAGAGPRGALLGGTLSRRYRSEPAPGASLTLLAHASDAAQAVHQAEVLADAVALVRDLVNTAPSDLVPAMFAARAEQVAADSGLSVTVLDEKALAEGGYGGILGVGQGSVHPPRLGRLGDAPHAASRSPGLARKGGTLRP